MLKPGIKIAISGKSGCGNSTVSRLLAQTLDLRMINYTFRNLAIEEGLELNQLRSMAETDEHWDTNLDKKQIQLAQEGGCVLGSRLAIWLLKDADLTIYLTASSDIRAGRIHQREGGNLNAILLETMERDRRDRDRYLKLYKIDNDIYQFADLVIDTTHRDPKMVLDDIIITLRIKKLL